MKVPEPGSVAILFHAKCYDGFGAAYAAWKRCGEQATYFPVEHGKPYPSAIEGMDVVIADFSYDSAILAEIAAKTKSLTVLDHHTSEEASTRTAPQFVFDNDHSGASLSWSFFHPGEEVPELIRYIEDGDLYKFVLPDSRAILAYLYTQALTFPVFEAAKTALEDPIARAELLAKGRAYREQYERMTAQIVDHAKLVSFEGYECYFAAATRTFASDTGHALAAKKGPLALIVSADPDQIKVSLRGDGTVDVSAIAKRFGGGGHYSAASFRLPYNAPVPWKLLPESK